MARLHSSTPPPTLSVLDRLLDDEPENRGDERQSDYPSGLRQLRESVVRDLQWLLNARVGRSPVYDGSGRHEQDPLHGTVLCFGLPDITTVDLKNVERRDAMRRSILAAIKKYEPRLDFVSVGADEEHAEGGETLFRIEARLLVDPEPIRLTFDAAVSWRDRNVEIRSA